MMVVVSGVVYLRDSNGWFSLRSVMCGVVLSIRFGICFGCISALSCRRCWLVKIADQSMWMLTWLVAVLE